MKVLAGDFREWERHPVPTSCTIGMFDGVHLGHQAVIAALAENAGDGKVGVITFREHPLALLNPDRLPPLLTNLEQRLELFAAAGVAVAAVLDFPQVREMAAADFVATIVSGVMRASHVAVGHGFRFGRGGTGDEELLRQLGAELGFTVAILDIVGGDVPIRSTAVRNALAAGDVRAAAVMLGRPFQLRGVVVAGDKRGRQLGFPTANLRLDPGLAIPQHGVYSAMTGIGDDPTRESVVNVGVRPTFDGSAEVVEVHILDADLELYGEELKVDFVDRIRPERRFNGINELVAQIDRDIVTARSQLTG